MDMDHLITAEERQKRWYAKHIRPRYVSYESYSIPISSLTESRTKLCELLQTNGFAIISDTLTLEECNYALSLGADYLEAASFAEEKLCSSVGNLFVEKEEHSAKPTIKTPSLFPATVEGGILPFYGSGHSTFMWYLRTHDNVKKIFSSIHNVSQDRLSTSLDGMILWSSSNYPTDVGWFHIDQNPIAKPKFASIQGLVNLINCTEQTGGNVLVAKSHHFFPHHYVNQENRSDVDKFYTKRLQEIDGGDWLEIDPNDKVILGNPENIICCLLQAGDVLIWDSRVVHCSHPPSISNLDKRNCNKYHGAKCDDSTLIRGAGLVNMIPSMNVKSMTRQRRLEAVKSQRTLTHWVDKVSGLGEEKIEDIEKENSRINLMKSWEQINQKKILLSYTDLDFNQQNMI